MISPVHTWIAEKTGIGNDLNDLTLREWQMARLKDLIEYAKTKTKFYKDLPVLFHDISELPFTTPEDVAADPFAFLAIPQNEIARITTISTSGTTGIKKRIFFSEADIERIKEYFAVGMRSLTKPGWHTEILISDETVNSLGYLLKSALESIGVTSGIQSHIPDVLTAINAARGADCLVGMPAEILCMCRVEPELRPKTILLTADYVPESIITAIGEAWHCDVFTHYGMTENGFGYAVDCEYHSGYHTRDAGLIVEIIDPETDNPCENGQLGEIVLTMLCNEAMPLIRYRTGDFSRFINSPCSCNSNLKRLDRIISRYETDQQIHLLDEILFSYPEVKGFNASLIKEENGERLHLIIDSSEEIDEGTLAKFFPGKKIRIKYDVNDPFTHRGKRKLNIIERGHISALILSSGLSERMGNPKALLMWDENKTFLEKIISEYVESGCTTIICTVNPLIIEECQSLISDTRIKFVLNEHPDLGRLHSVKLGLNELPENSACLIQNIDNPYIGSEAIKKILNSFDPDAWCSPEYHGRGGHPVLLPKKIIREFLKEAPSDSTLQDFLKRFPKKTVQMDDDSILKNVNTPEDYQILISRQLGCS